MTISAFKRYEINYLLDVGGAEKLIDKLRCRNGNLNISLTVKEFEDKVYA